MAQKQLSIILVSYNGQVWLEKCLNSLVHLHGWQTDQRSNPFEVILVDNASEQDIVGWVQKKYPWVKTVALAENRGFSAGNNVGLQRASADTVMLLNTDTEFAPDTDLLGLVERLQRQPQAAALTPKVVLTDGSLDHACHRGFPTPWNAVMYFSGIARVLPWFPPVAGYRQSWKNLNRPHQIDACSGAAMLVKKAAIEEVGYLDESYFMYAEDIDWCYRFKQAGWEIWYDPSVVITHHKHKSGMGGKQVAWEVKERTISAFYDTMKQFFRKFYSHRYPRFVMGGVFVMIELLKSRKIRRERKRYAQ